MDSTEDCRDGGTIWLPGPLMGENGNILLDEDIVRIDRVQSDPLPDIQPPNVKKPHRYVKFIQPIGTGMVSVSSLKKAGQNNMEFIYNAEIAETWSLAMENIQSHGNLYQEPMLIEYTSISPRGEGRARMHEAFSNFFPCFMPKELKANNTEFFFPGKLSDSHLHKLSLIHRKQPVTEMSK